MLRSRTILWVLGLPLFYLVFLLAVGTAGPLARPALAAVARVAGDAAAGLSALAPTPAAGSSTVGAPQVPFGYPKDDELYGACNPVQNCQCSCSVTQNPVNTATGNFWHTFAALTIPARGRALEFDWSYNSLDALTPDTSMPMGPGWTHSYNMWIDEASDNGVAKYQVHQENGSVARFLVSDLSTDANTMATLSIDGKGNFVFTHKHGQDAYYFYPLTVQGNSTPGKLWVIVDRHGYQTNLHYDNLGRLSAVTDSSFQRSLNFSYTVTGTTSYLTQVTDPASRHVNFGYDTNGNLQTAIDEAGQATTFTYDNSNGPWVLTQMHQPNGGVVTNVYDTHNRVTQQTDPLNRVTAFSYVTGTNPIAMTTTVTDPLSEVTVYNYYTNTLRLLSKNPGSTQEVWQYLYDDTPAPATYHTGITATIDPLGHEWTQAWDSNGNLLRQTDPLGRTTRYAYDSGNNLVVMTNALGIPITYTYISTITGDLLQTAQPLTQTGQIQTTSFQYDPYHAGDVITTTDALDHNWRTDHDTNYGYVLNAHDPLGNLTQYTYDNVGRRISQVSPLGYTTSYTYNAYNALTVLTDTRGYTTTNTYDASRNLQTVTDANHHTTTYQYDLDNEPTAVLHPDGTHATTYYDADGQVISRTNELSQTTGYSHDTFNRLTSVTDPLARSTEYAYDQADRLTVMTDALGNPAQYGYDVANQPITITYALTATTPNVYFQYDALGRRTVMTDGTGTTLYTYDSLNRLTSLRNGAGTPLTYTYDLANNLAELDYPGNLAVGYSYDDANRMTTLEDWLGNSTHFTYDANGNLTQQVGANNVYQTYGYDSENVLTATTATYIPPSAGASLLPNRPDDVQLLALTYTRDPAELLTATGDSSTGGATYGYDPRNRLTSETPSSVDSPNTWNYDPATEITHTVYLLNNSTTNTVLTYDSADELLHLSQRQGLLITKNITFTYDLDGNRTQADDSVSGIVRNYSYDQEDRLYEFGQWRYKYDGDGLRMIKEDILGKPWSIASGSYTWDVSEGLPLLLSDGHASFLYGPGGKLIEEITAGNAYYYHADQLGSIRLLSDMKGTAAATYTYDPYGNTLSSTGTLYNPFRYAGEYQDDESGFYYLRARYYDPATQQFITPDPLLKQAGQQRPYAYAAGDPINETDPTGLGCSQGGLPVEECEHQGSEWIGPAPDAGGDSIGSATDGGTSPGGSSYVVRGGTGQAQPMIDNYARSRVSGGGMSVQYGPGASHQDLAAAAQFKNPKYCWTTEAEFSNEAAQLGYRVEYDPTGRASNPYHTDVYVYDRNNKLLNLLPPRLADAWNRLFVQHTETNLWKP